MLVHSIASHYAISLKVWAGSTEAEAQAAATLVTEEAIRAALTEVLDSKLVRVERTRSDEH